jgi:two-component system cell cycle sensor histidine kinase/response regulator CckA
LSIVAIWAIVRSSRRLDLPANVRKGLGYIGAGLGISTLGSLYLSILYLAVGRIPELFGFDDVLTMLAYPLAIVGLLHFPLAEHRAAGRCRILIDGAAFVLGVGVPLWLIDVQPVLVTVPDFQLVQHVLWPLLAFGGIIVVNSSLLTRSPVPSRRAFWTLLAALGVSWMCDLFSVLNAPDKLVLEGSINWIDISIALSLCLYSFAAWRFQTDRVTVGRSLRPATFSPMPMITIVAVALWAALVALLGTPDPDMSNRMLVSVVLLLAILLVRETLVLRDSLRWAAAEAQRESRARFEDIVRHSSDVIMVVDQTRQIQFASPATAFALGLTPEQLTGREFLDLVHVDERKRGGEFFAELVRCSGTDAMRTVRWRLRNSDGSYRHFETHGSNLRGESAGGGFVLNSRDITERLQLDERLHQEKKMEAVGRLAGGVAHDFNNLLAVVLANSELGLMGLPNGHPVQADLQEIRRASARGSALTGRLLALGRRQNLRPQIVSPATLLQDTLALLQRIAGEAVKLSVRVAADTGCIRADPNDAEQALINLVTNASDAMPKTGGMLTISLRSETLDKPLASDYLTAKTGRYVVITVTDNGVGMDEATRARLFEPFFSTKESGRGSGLGLAAVFGMVKTADGGIVVKSKPGQGTVIELWLPEMTGLVPSVTPATETGTGGGDGATILLVEDEAGVRKSVQRILEANGYIVLAAGDAQEARAVLEQPGARDVALLLTDVVMPGQSGPALATDLVRQRPQLRVLFMSGYTGDELRTEELARAGGQLLCKPFSVAELMAKVRQVLAEPVPSR